MQAARLVKASSGVHGRSVTSFPLRSRHRYLVPSCVLYCPVGRAQAFSSILFLSEATESACWGPTIVVDQAPLSPLARRAWLAPAISNCLVSFPGNLLHGVLPGASLHQAADLAPDMYSCR